MMVPIFATLTLALGAAGLGLRATAIAALLICLTLAAGLFLFEIHSAADGFAMPWLQVRGDCAGVAA